MFIAMSLIMLLIGTAGVFLGILLTPEYGTKTGNRFIAVGGVLIVFALWFIGVDLYHKIFKNKE